MAMTIEQMQEMMAKLVEQVTILPGKPTTAEGTEGTNSKTEHPRKEGSPKLDLKNFTRMRNSAKETEPGKTGYST